MKKILLFILLLVVSGWAANKYCDNAASGTNAGTSWTNAWESFADISWGDIAGGDTLFISGGTTSQTYVESMMIDDIGAATYANPVTIMPGVGAGKNGVMTISSDTGMGIWVISENYVTINGNVGGDCHIRVTGCHKNGVKASGFKGVKFNYLEIDDNGTENEQDGITTQDMVEVAGGSEDPILEISYCKIHNNWQDQIHSSEGWNFTRYGRVSIHHNEIYDCQDDGIETGVHGIDFYNNTVYRIASGKETGGHPDALSFFAGYLRCYNNTVYNFQNKIRGSNSYIQPGFTSNEGHGLDGHMRVYNNLFYHDTATIAGDLNRGLELSVSGDLDSIVDVLIANNTFVGMPYFACFYSPKNTADEICFTDSIFFVNNIFHNCGRLGAGIASILLGRSGETQTYGSWGLAEGSIWDYNLVSKDADGTIVTNYKGTNYTTVTTLKAATDMQDNFSSNAEPLLNASYKISSVTSPAVGTGLDLSDFFSTDKDGVTRTTWDLGCYKYVSGSKKCVITIAR